MLESVKTELETNDLLAEDFPEVCHPVRSLERITRRCQGQLCGGKPTWLTWVQDTLVLPTVKGSKAGGAVVKVAGLTASIRGLKHKRPDGVNLRPDLVVIDDAQTDESARSASQCVYRERVLSGAVLGMAGPGKKISGIMPCTVIAPGDVADSVLDPRKHPEWNGERTKLVYSFPAREDLWERYAVLRADSFRAGRGGADATEFYRQNRAAMDEGAVVAWPERFKPDELSAVQHAMNLRIDDPVAFASEYQNDPLPLEQEAPGGLAAAAVCARLSHLPRGTVPGWCTRLVAAVDVQQDLLFWCVAGWADGFSGAVVDYGAYPDQGRPYFTLADARPTLAAATGIGSVEGAVWEGLARLTKRLIERDWPTEGGAFLRVERLLVDAGWQGELIRRFCRQSAHAATITPSLGRGITAGQAPIDQWPRQPGERRGHAWVQRVPKAGFGRLLIYDANVWKSFLAARLQQPQGESGALVLFGGDAGPHRMFADHLMSEYTVRTENKTTGRQVDEFKLRVHRPDNHLLDAATLCCVAASVQGVTLSGQPGGRPRPRRQSVSYAEMQARARGGR
jgi:Phage terminase large subunit (GpA)